MHNTTPQAEIVAIGNELLIGRTQDTNSHWLAQQLTAVGLTVGRISAVADDAGAIRAALAQALAESNPVLITGGLGPTKDDITKKTLAEFFNSPLVEDAGVRAHLEAWYAQRGRTVNPLILTQALVPAGAAALPNPVGSAPGLHFTTPTGRHIFCMPGVPHEMKAIVQGSVLPFVMRQFVQGYRMHHTLRTVGKPESELAQHIADIENALPPEMQLAYNPILHQVDLRLTLHCTAASRQALQPVYDETLNKLRNRVEPWLYAEQEETLEAAVGRMLVARGWHIAMAESCTGGALGAALVREPGASRYVRGGWMAYYNAIKLQQLGVDPDVIRQHGAVSEATARAMAEGARRTLGADVALSTTGIAGPDGGTPEKPVGTVWVGYADANGSHAEKFQFENDRQRNINRTVVMALDVLRRALLARATHARV